MSRYSGIRHLERRKLNRSLRCLGDDGYIAPIVFDFSSRTAVQVAIEHLRKNIGRTDLRTGEGKTMVAALQRLEVLHKEIGR